MKSHQRTLLIIAAIGFYVLIEPIGKGETLRAWVIGFVIAFCLSMVAYSYFFKKD